MTEVQQELSERAIRIARAIDRLPAGDFVIVLVKPDLAALSWHLEIHRREPIKEMDLPKREVRID